MVDKMIRVASRGKDGTAKSLNSDRKGNLRVSTPKNVVVAKHLNQPVANKYFGETVSTTGAIGTVIPADYGSFRGKSFYVVNNTNISINRFEIYGHIDKENPSVATKIGQTESIASGEVRYFSYKDLGLENINDVPYEGVSLQVRFGEVGTGSFDLYFIGESDIPSPKNQEIKTIFNDTGRTANREINVDVPEWASRAIVTLDVTKITGRTDSGLAFYTLIRSGGEISTQIASMATSSITDNKRVTHIWGGDNFLGDAELMGDTRVSSFDPRPVIQIIATLLNEAVVDMSCEVVFLR